MSYDGTLKFDTKIDSSGFKSGIDKLGGLASTGLKATGAILGGAATAIAGIGAAAIKAGSEFEAGMSEVKAISGASASEMEKLTAKAKEMGAKTKFSASESADAFKYMAMAGWETGDMLDGIEGIMNLAAASGEDLATTSDIVTDALTAFGLEAKDSGHFADVLAAASSSANTNVGMLGESFKYVAPVAGALNMSVEDTSLALGLMANSGIKASQAGTSLRSALTNLANPTEQMQDLMARLGLATKETATEIDSGKLQRAQTNLANRTADLEKAQIKYNEAVAKYGLESAQAQKAALDLQKAQNNLEQANYDLATAQEGETKTTGIQNNLLVDSAGNTKSLREVMLTLRSTFADLTEEEKAQAAATLFGKEAMSGMLAIINASDEDFEKLTAAIDGCDGAAKEMADTMNDNLQGQITLLKSALEGLGISLYEEMQEPLKDIVKEANNMVGELQEAFNSGGLDAMVKKAGDVFAQVVVKAAEAGPKLIETAADLVHSFCESLKERRTLIGKAGGELIAALIKALLDCAGDIWETVAFIVTDIAVHLSEHADEIGRAAVTMVEKILNAFIVNLPKFAAAAAKIVVTIAKALIDNLPEIIASVKAGIKEVLWVMTEESPELFSGKIASFIKGFVEGFMGVVGPVLSGLAEALKTLFNVLSSLPPETLEALGKALGVVAAGILGMKVKDGVTSSVSKFSGVLDIFKGKLSGLPSLLTGILPKITSALGGIGGAASKVGGILSSIGGAIGPALSSIAGAVGPALASVGTAIVEGIGAIVTALGGWVVVAIVAAIAAVIAVICNWDKVKEFFTETVPNWWNNTVLPLLGKLGEALAGFFTETIPAIASKIADGFVAVGGAIVDFFTGIIGKASEWISGMAEKAMQFGGAFIDVITGFFSGLPETIWGFLTSIVGKVGEWISGMTEKAMELGAAFIDRIIAFFTDLPYKIGYLLGTIIGSVASWVMEMGAKAAELGAAFVDRIVTFFAELPGRVWEFLVNVVTRVGEWTYQMVQKAVETGSQFLGKVVEFFAQLPGRVWEFLSGAVMSAAQWVAEMVQKAAETGADFLGKVAEFFSQLPGRIWEFLSGTFSRVAEWAASMITKAAEVGRDFVQNVIQFITELPGRIWDLLTGIVESVADWGKKLWEKGSAAAKSLFDAVVDGVKALPGKMMETGKAIINGVWEGICKAKDAFVKNVKDFFSGIVDGIKDKLKIHSPSKVMQDEVGHPIVDGVTKGIDDKKGEAEGSMSRLKDGILAVASKMTGGMDAESQAGAQAMAEHLKGLASAAPGIMTRLVTGSMGELSKLSPQMAGAAEEGAGKFSIPIEKLVSLTPNIMSGMVASSVKALAGLSSQMDRTAVQASGTFSTSMTRGMASAQSAMVSSGAAMVSGLMQGLNGASGQLYKAVADIAGNVVKSIKGALGIHSPSKVMQDEIGQWLPPGIGEGFEDAMPALERQVDAEMAALAGRLRAAVEIETGSISVKAQEDAQYRASTAYPKGGDTYVEEKIEQTNNYHVPVATPSEVSKANRAAARKLLGGVT